MAASRLLRSALRRTGVWILRLHPESSGTAASSESPRTGRAGLSVRLLPAAGAAVRLHGPLPAARGLCGPQRRLRTARGRLLAPRHGRRAPLHLLPGPLAASRAGHLLLSGCMGSLAAGPVDLPGAGTGVAGSCLPLGRPANGLVGAGSLLPGISGSGAGLPGNAPPLPVRGIQCPDGAVHRHARPTLQHVQPCRSGAVVRRAYSDPLPACRGILFHGGIAAAVLPAGRSSAPSVHSV